MILQWDVYTGFMRTGARTAVVTAVLAMASACGGGGNPTQPDSGGSTPPGTGHIVTGTTVNALTDGAASGVTIATGGAALGVTSATGTFSVSVGTSGNNRITLSNPGFVERQTGIQAPSLNLRLSLIPATGFDLARFDQMFRHTSSGILARWTSPPHLLIERRVLQFTDVGAASYAALTDTLTDQEVATITTDLTDGYAILTDGKLGTFASVSQQTTATGSTVAVGNEGRIVVTRVEGLTSATGFWGYARWSTTPDGQVTRGFMMVDATFARSASPAHVPYKRSLHMHELGHTLGCQHVVGIESVMNSSARIEPNTFDRSAARIAMLRPVGNRTPDIDPTGHAATTASPTSAKPLWHGAH